jgi:predicted GTPase
MKMKFSAIYFEQSTNLSSDKLLVGEKKHFTFMTVSLEHIGTSTILLVGPTGGGKSSLGNHFLRHGVFQTSDGPISETFETMMEQRQIQTGPNSMFIHCAI